VTPTVPTSPTMKSRQPFDGEERPSNGIRTPRGRRRGEMTRSDGSQSRLASAEDVSRITQARPPDQDPRQRFVGALGAHRLARVPRPCGSAVDGPAQPMNAPSDRYRRHRDPVGRRRRVVPTRDRRFARRQAPARLSTRGRQAPVSPAGSRCLRGSPTRIGRNTAARSPAGTIVDVVAVMASRLPAQHSASFRIGGPEDISSRCGSRNGFSGGRSSSSSASCDAAMRWRPWSSTQSARRAAVGSIADARCAG
jgi:hypothetical protein